MKFAWFIGVMLLVGTVRAADAPPKAEEWHSKVSHAPKEPKSGEAVRISTVVKPHVTAVTLEYQIVDPGAYIELKDPAYKTNWASLPMKEENLKAGRGFVATIPAADQKHRRLIRYRFVGTGGDGKELHGPARTEECPNYAYFVYDGVPGWSGAIHPGDRDPRVGQPLAFTADQMRRIQPYHLIGKRTSIENVTWREQQHGGKEYKYTGTLVAGGVAHDHVRYRIRGGVWRYAMGKNMWKFDFPEGKRLQAADDWGREYPVKWAKLNLRPCISMGNYGRRGEQGMYESVSHRLFNLAGVASPRTHWVHLRIINEPQENPANQYQGDFWGLYLAIENEDGRFLKAHDLPDGNLYKMFGGSGDLNNQGDGQPADKSDLNAFLNAYNTREQSEQWWRDNLELERYYSYRAILECIRHYDISDGKNYFYYRNPETKRWQVVPWDLDLTWGDHMYGVGEEPFKARVLVKPAFRIEYQNRLREVRDLLFNTDECWRLIDEYAMVIGDPTGKPTILEADRRKWDHHPALSIGGQAGQGQFYIATPTRDFAGMVRQMKEFAKMRGEWVDANLAMDPRIPTRPTITYAGPAGYPVDQLKFTSSPYKGAAPFAAVKWRVGEVSKVPFQPGVKREPGVYEITPVWESAESPEVGGVTVPAEALTPGKTYRARVRMKDATGRWSRWSEPVEFVAGRKG
jgi:hypothetical protein